MNQFKTCLNLSILTHFELEDELSLASQAGFDTVGLRINKLQDYLSAGHTMEEAKQLIKKYKINPVEMNFFQNWIFTTQENQPEVLSKFCEIADISQQIGSKIIICTTSYEDGASKDVGMAVKNYEEICNIAAEYNLIVGLEFVPWSEVSTVKQAWEIIDKVDHPNGGLVLDCFHFFEGDSTFTDLEKVPIEKVVMVHLNDLERVEINDLATLARNYRPLPGEGEYNFDLFLKYLMDRNYQGFYNLEIIYPQYQNLDGLELTRRAKKSVDTLLENFLNNRKNNGVSI